MIASGILSICEFGSYARGTSDNKSDKDLLIVADCVRSLKELKQEYEAEGWSVAGYTTKRLASIKENGGLFLQHLKLEGRIVFDRWNYLRDLLSDFTPKPCYRTDLAKSFELLKPALRNFDDDWCRLFVSDVMYVFLRNALIFELASRGIYKFDFDELITEAAQCFCLTECEAEIFRSLRLEKYSFRSRNFSKVDAGLQVQRILLVEKVFQQTIDRDSSKKKSIPMRGLPYATLREIEGYLLESFSLQDLEEKKVPKEIQRFWSMLNEPRTYSWPIRQLTEADLATISGAVTQQLERAKYAACL